MGLGLQVGAVYLELVTAWGTRLGDVGCRTGVCGCGWVRCGVQLARLVQ
jgi:hypothetical protein